MKWKTLITSLLIASSSMATVAVAQPSANDPAVYNRHRRFERNPYYDRHQDRDRDRDRDSDQGWDSSRTWFPPTVVPFVNGYDDGYNQRYGYNDGWQPLVAPVANLTSQQEYALHGATYHAVRLDVMRGRLFIGKFLVEYENGQTQLLQVNRWVDDGGEGLTIRLNGRRPIKRVIVYTPDGSSRAAYQIAAR